MRTTGHRRARRTIGVLAGGMMLGAVGTAPATAASPVQFSLVQYSPPGPDLPVSNAKLNGEYVTIRNTGGAWVTLTGWTVHDTTRRADHVYRFGAFRLAPRATVVIHTGQGANTAAHRYWGRSVRSGRYAYVWSNSGDTVYLRTSTGAVADTCRWVREAGLRAHGLLTVSRTNAG